MFGPFTRKPVIETEVSTWIFQAFAWALRNFGSDVFYHNIQLVTPTSRHFPERANSAESLVESTFLRVRKYANLENWPCRIEAQERDPNPIIAPTVVLKGLPSGPAGTFSYATESKEAVITYNPDLVSQPESLVATFAHELAHYLGGIAREHPPGGEDYWEHVTDLVAVYLGFGIFLANSAFTFEQYADVGTHGWRSGRQGYMSEYELTYALALFCILKRIDSKEVLPHLDRHLRGFYKNSAGEILGSTEMPILKAIDVRVSDLNPGESLDSGP
jgi:hypothetical protein